MVVAAFTGTIGAGAWRDMERTDHRPQPDKTGRLCEPFELGETAVTMRGWVSVSVGVTTNSDAIKREERRVR